MFVNEPTYNKRVMSAAISLTEKTLSNPSLDPKVRTKLEEYLFMWRTCILCPVQAITIWLNAINEGPPNA